MLSATRPHSVPDSGPGETLLDRFDAVLATSPEATVIIDGDTTITFAQLYERASRAAAGLRALGVRRGDRVVLQLPNWWETVVASWAVLLSGAVLVPLVTIYRERELAFVADQVEARAIVTAGEYRGHDHAAAARRVLDELGSDAAVVTVRSASGDTSFENLMNGAVRAPLPPTTADDIALVLYTSGTTADPKGVLHSHRTLLAELADVAGWCGLDASTRVFMASPLSHITGISYAVLLPVVLGCSCALQERWQPDDAMRIIEQHGCTFTVSATPFLSGLVDTYTAARRPCHLRTFVCGGADIPTPLVRRAREVLGTTVLRTYGSTEVPTSTMADPAGDPAVEAGAEGRPMGGNEIRLVRDDTGATELLLRGPEMFLGYLDASLNDAAFEPDGWFHTGDVAELDAGGRLRITGRIKDIINRGGEKYSTAEVEAVLAALPGVRDVAVVGYPDPVLVERACACLVVEGPPPTLEDLRAAVVAAGLAIQKSPERLLIVDDLPRTPSGKIQRFVLRDTVAAGLPADGARIANVTRPPLERNAR